MSWRPSCRSGWRVRDSWRETESVFIDTHVTARIPWEIKLADRCFIELVLDLELLELLLRILMRMAPGCPQRR